MNTKKLCFIPIVRKLNSRLRICEKEDYQDKIVLFLFARQYICTFLNLCVSQVCE